MEIILREDIEKLGIRGDVVKVAAGYARNFLLPRRLAVEATGSNKKIVEQERQAGLRREAVEVADAQELAKLLEPTVVEISMKAGENDHLFGSVTLKDIADQLEAKNFHIDRKKIVLPEAIKTLGEFLVPVKLHKQVTVNVKVIVKREE